MRIHQYSSVQDSTCQSRIRGEPWCWRGETPNFGQLSVGARQILPNMHGRGQEDDMKTRYISYHHTFGCPIVESYQKDSVGTMCFF